jgi:hypothetical protein
MHGNEQVFLNSMSGFLGGYYLTLALMNAVAAFYLWESGKSKTLFRVGPLAFTTALAWLIVAGVFTIIAPIALGGGAGMLRLPLFFENAVNRLMNPTVYTVGSIVILVVMFAFRRFFVQPMGGVVALEPVAVVDGAFDDRSQLRRHRHQARQRADRGDDLPAGLLHLAGRPPRRAERRPPAARRAAAGSPRRRKSAGLARPGLHRADLHGGDHRGADRVGGGAAGAAGRTGQQREDAQSRRRPPGTFWACRKCSSTTIRGWRAWCCRAWSSSG